MAARAGFAEAVGPAGAGDAQRLVEHRHGGVDHVLRLADGVVARLLLRGELLGRARAAVEQVRVDVLAHGLGDVGKLLGLLERKALLERGRGGGDLAVGLGDGLLERSRHLVGLGDRELGEVADRELARDVLVRGVRLRLGDVGVDRGVEFLHRVEDFLLRLAGLRLALAHRRGVGVARGLLLPFDGLARFRGAPVLLRRAPLGVLGAAERIRRSFFGVAAVVLGFVAVPLRFGGVAPFRRRLGFGGGLLSLLAVAGRVRALPGGVVLDALQVAEVPFEAGGPVGGSEDFLGLRGLHPRGGDLRVAQRGGGFGDFLEAGEGGGGPEGVERVLRGGLRRGDVAELVEREPFVELPDLRMGLFEVAFQRLAELLDRFRGRVLFGQGLALEPADLLRGLAELVLGAGGEVEDDVVEVLPELVADDLHVVEDGLEVVEDALQFAQAGVGELGVEPLDRVGGQPLGRRRRGLPVR